MLWPRNAACGCLLLLAGTVAAQTPSRARDCYRGRPLTPRYRRWLAPSVALDLSAGVLVAGSDDFRFPGWVGQVAVLGGDYIGAALQVETFRHFGRRDVGVYGGLKFGSVPGVIASFVLPLLIIASRIPET